MEMGFQGQRGGGRWAVVAVLVAVALGFSAAGTKARAVQGTRTPDFAALEQTVLDELKQTGTPGAAVAIVQGDQVVMARGFGTANVETREPVRPEMLFRLGSTTKMLTAIAVNVLADEGRLKLDEPIGTLLKDMHASLKPITAHQLLTHNAGIRDEAPMFGSHDDSALRARINSMDASFAFAPPGDVYSYANPGYWIAGYLAEVAAGKPYADVMHEKVFAPIGMARTTLRPTTAMTFPLAQGHDKDAKGGAAVIRPAADNAASWPAGSVFSSVNDLSRFVIAMLNEGRLDGRQVLPPAVVRRLTTGYVDMPAGDGAKYGYGLEVNDVNGTTVWRHGGSRSGYGSSIAMVPSRKVGVIVLGNLTGSGLPRTTAKALELAASLKAAPRTAPESAGVPISAVEMAEFAGTYSQTTTGSTQLFVKDGRLFLKVGAAAPMPVTRQSATRFIGTRMPEAPLRFFITRGRDGKALYLHLGTRASRKIGPPTTT